MADARFENMWRFLEQSNYEDLADMGADMKCTICSGILINAHSSTRCGCRYCRRCIETYLGGQSRLCPGHMDDCRLEPLDIDTNIHADHAINHRISRSLVACRHSCGCRCELRSMEEHERACGRRPARCPYVGVGCTETQLASDRVNEHLARASALHTTLLVTSIGALQGELCLVRREAGESRLEVANLTNENKLAREENKSIREENKSIKEEIKSVKEENKSIREEIKSVKEEIKSVKEEIKSVKEEIKSVKEEIKSVKEENMFLRAELERQVHQREEELAGDTDDVWEELDSDEGELERRVAEIEVTLEQHNRREVVWRIGDWAAKSQSARAGNSKSIFSDAFSSHENGYRMCLSVWPDGRGTGRGTHLALFFHLMQAPLNTSLSWPFRRTVTLSLVEQRARRDHASRAFTFDESPTKPSWGMPACERGRGIGTYTMVELAALSGATGLCLDDTVLIKCCVTK